MTTPAPSHLAEAIVLLVLLLLGAAAILCMPPERGMPDGTSDE